MASMDLGDIREKDYNNEDRLYILLNVFDDYEESDGQFEISVIGLGTYQGVMEIKYGEDEHGDISFYKKSLIYYGVRSISRYDYLYLERFGEEGDEFQNNKYYVYYASRKRFELETIPNNINKDIKSFDTKEEALTYKQNHPLIGEAERYDIITFYIENDEITVF